MSASNSIYNTGMAWQLQGLPIEKRFGVFTFHDDQDHCMKNIIESFKIADRNTREK